jgi:single-strand DNA-binding protein
MVNKWIGIGNLTNDIEVRQTQTGLQVASFSIACNEKHKDKQGVAKESVEYVNIVAWDKLAGICGEYLHKGMTVYIEGKLQTRKWQDKDGRDRWTTEIIARDMKMIGSKGGGGERSDQGGGQSGYAPQGGGASSMGEDCPF